MQISIYLYLYIIELKKIRHGTSFTQIVNLQELTQIVNHADDAIEIFRHLNDASSRSNKKQSLSSIIGQKLQEIDSIQALR